MPRAAVVQVLEDRTLLSANFGLIDGALLLDGFSQTAEENLTIGGTDANLQFTLSEGVWSGANGEGLAGAGTATLTVSPGAVAGPGGVRVDASAIAADISLQSADFTMVAGGLNLSGAG